MVASGTESEVKLDAGVGFVLPDMDEVLEGIVGVRRPEQRLTACYVDTADLRLLRAGVTLRHRHERDASGDDLQEWTLKLPMAPRGPMVVRRELRWPGPPDTVPAEVSSLVRAWRRSEPLVTVARLVTVRQRTALRRAAGDVVAEIDDDVVSVMEGPRLAARFRQIEVELQPGAPKRLVAAVVSRLEAAGARAGDDRAKVVRAIGPRAVAAPDVAAVELSGRATIAEVVSSTVAACYLQLVRHDVGVRLDEDPEDVHQARVATRRLRSDLRFLRRLLDREWVHAARAELGWLAGVLGAVRDADVLTARLRLAAAGLPPQDAPAAEELLGRLATERADARAQLLAALESDRYAALLDTLALAVTAPPLAVAPGDPRQEGAAEAASDPDGVLKVDDPADQGGADGPYSAPEVDGEPAVTGATRARAAMPGLVARPWRHLAAAVEALGDQPSDEVLHDIRIGAKRLRYACETAAPVSGAAARSMSRASADLQTALGDLNDAVVAGAWLRRHGLTGGPAVALAAGQLIAGEQRHAAAARAAWPRAWKRLRRKKLRGWLAG